VERWTIDDARTIADPGQGGYVSDCAWVVTLKSTEGDATHPVRVDVQRGRLEMNLRHVIEAVDSSGRSTVQRFLGLSIPPNRVLIDEMGIHPIVDADAE
jgi:hypothetical protein